MKLLKTYQNNSGENLSNTTFSIRKSVAGFTLIEILVVTAILTTIAGFGMFMGMESYRNYLVNSERDLIAGLLAKTRNDSVNNVNQAPHGLRIDSASYTLFEGDDYSDDPASYEVIGGNAGIDITPSTPFDVIFEQLSGNTTFNGDIDLSFSGRTVRISVNNQGRIDW